MKHLVFYDGECGLCDRFVQLLLQIDKKKVFAFAPLQGETAARLLQGQRSLVDMDTQVLIEDYNGSDPQIFFYGQAVFRIFWLLGGWWKGIGIIGFLPDVLYNWAYRFIARRRLLIFGGAESCRLPDSAQRDRFLP